MEQTTAGGTRCPRCSAAVRPGAPWCTQCYAPLSGPGPGAAPEQRPAPEPVPAEAHARPAAAPHEQPHQQPPDQPQAAVPVGTWPCTACSQPNDLALAACGGCGSPFLAAARDTPLTVVLPGVGDLLALSPVRRVGTAVAVVLAFVVVTALLALLLA